MHAQDGNPAGIDANIAPATVGKLRAALGALGYDVIGIGSLPQWLQAHPDAATFLAIPQRTPDLVREMRAAAPRAGIVAVCADTPSALTYRAYVKAGASGIVEPDLPPDKLTQVLMATLAGFVVLPPRAAHSIVRRLEEPPGDLHLTARDKEIVGLVARGASPAAIAAETGYSERHLRRIVTDLLARMGVTNRAHAAAMATRWGLGGSEQHTREPGPK